MKNNYVLVIFDSCRFDSFVAAKTPQISRLGALEQRYSYASWTVPSHHVFLMGVSPHRSPKKVFASEVYKKDFMVWSERLNIPDIVFRGFVPRLSLPAFLRDHGYLTHARMSMPVLNQTTVMNEHFDSYQLMDAHNDFDAILDSLEFKEEQPSFYIINVGETHYPYTLPGETAEDLPRISGVHGVFKKMDEMIQGLNAVEVDPDEFINEETLLPLKDKQRRNVEYLDGLFEKLYDLCPENTYITVTADHGELFGEDGYLGHGPIIHNKVFEVPFLEGKRP